MRTAGIVIALLGVAVIYLGWQGKMLPAWRALIGQDPWGGSSGGEGTTDHGWLLVPPGLGGATT